MQRLSSPVKFKTVMIFNFKKGGTKMKAYVLSEENGTVQIGNTLFCLGSGKSFLTHRKGLKELPSIDVEEKSWKEAKKAFLKMGMEK